MMLMMGEGMNLDVGLCLGMINKRYFFLGYVILCVDCLLKKLRIGLKDGFKVKYVNYGYVYMLFNCCFLL